MSPFRYSLGHHSPCQGTGEGVLDRLLPAPGANLQTYAGTRLDGAFCCLHYNLSSSPPHSWGGSLLPAVLLPNTPPPPALSTPQADQPCDMDMQSSGLWPEEGSYLRLLTPPLPRVHSLAVILALLPLLGNHAAAAEILSALQRSASALKTSTCSGPLWSVLVGTAHARDILARPHAARQHPPREPAQELGATLLC